MGRALPRALALPGTAAVRFNDINPETRNEHHRAEDFRPYQKNTLLGFVTLVLPDAGVKIKECTWHSKNGKEWISFPSRSYIDRVGEKKWQPLVEFSETGEGWEQRNKFCDAAVAAVRRLAGGQESWGDAQAPDYGADNLPRGVERAAVPPKTSRDPGPDLNDAIPW